MEFEEYEELLRRAGVRRSPGGSLLFDQAAPEAASTVAEYSVADGSQSERSAADDAAAGFLTSRSRSRRHVMPPEAEVDDLGLLVCDEDLELIAGEVDFHTKALKSAVTSRLLALKSKIAASVDALEAERRFIVARSITLQNQADSLKESLLQERLRTGQARTYALSLIFWWRGERDVKDTFQRWRSYMLEKRRRRAAVKSAEAHHARALMRAFFASWRSGAHVSYRERMHAELDSRWADAAQAEASKFALVISRLEAELGATRAALEREVAARTEAEERFKQAFMRGVCALNFEALTVLKGSAAGTAGTAEGRPTPSPMRVHM